MPVLQAYRLAVIADPISAFGGIVAFNRVVDEDLAKEIREFRRCGSFECMEVCGHRGGAGWAGVMCSSGIVPVHAEPQAEP
eukprot:349751-Chlamydomonas_euryale.AAC.10